MKNIALALSGGGFRAAAFSLGTLSYLHSIYYQGNPLLENVKFIGSTSGGSITNLFYSAGRCEGTTFNDIYRDLGEILSGDTLIENVFKILNDDKIWKTRPDKSRNLINAFSIAYDGENILNGKTFGLLSEKLMNTHLNQVTINATEFANGLSFRFQSQDKLNKSPMGRVGNNYIYFKGAGMDSADKLKLADLLACSSCFPGGFEPFIFPDDFTYASLSNEELTNGINFTENPFNINTERNDPFRDEQFKSNSKRFGLMDGGVADNQAIDSVLKANNRRKDNNKFDLIIATDVSSYFMDGYTLPLEKKNFWSYISLRHLSGALLYFGLLFPVLLLLCFWNWNPWLSLFLVPNALSLITWILLRLKLRSSAAQSIRDKSTWGIEFFKFGKYFSHIRLSALKQFLASRLKSVLLLTNDIYLKQIRRHYYNMLYRDPELSKIIISNAIYDLSKVKQNAKSDPELDKVIGPNTLTEKDVGLLQPSSDLINTAERARLMPTTLWFDTNHEQEHSKAAVIATGQFTTCYNLLKYIKELESRPDHVLNSDLEELMVKLEADWLKFNTTSPYWLYNQLGTNIQGFKIL